MKQVCSTEHYAGGSKLVLSPYRPELTCTPTDEEKEVSGRLLVTNVPTGVSEEMLEMYLESRKRSGGGEIADFRFYEDYGTAVVSFVDVEGL